LVDILAAQLPGSGQTPVTLPSGLAADGPEFLVATCHGAGQSSTTKT